MTNVIGFDIDGVLADFTGGFRGLANEMFGVPEDVDAEQTTWRPQELTRKQYDAAWDYIKAHPEFWSELSPLITEQERQALAELNARYTVVYVTARHNRPEIVAATKDWLTRQWGLPGALYFAEHKTPLLAGYGDPLLGFLDDHPTKTKAYAEAGIPVYLRDHPYNRAVTGPPRVASVTEFLQEVGAHV